MNRLSRKKPTWNIPCPNLSKKWLVGHLIISGFLAIGLSSAVFTGNISLLILAVTAKVLTNPHVSCEPWPRQAAPYKNVYWRIYFWLFGKIVWKQTRQIKRLRPMILLPGDRVRFLHI